MRRRAEGRDVATVFIVAASDVVRLGLESLIATDARFAVVGSAPALTLLAAQSPEGVSADVVVFDTEGQHEETLAALRDFLEEMNEGENIPALVLIGRGQSDWVRNALREGIVRAVLPRAASSDEIIAAVEAVSAGLVTLDAETFGALLSPGGGRIDELSGARPDEGALPPPAPEIDALTPREREVLEMLASGLSNKEIAWRMKISEHTVKFHVASIFAKLDVSTRTEAVMQGIRKGLVMM
ncbi:MAG TPA: response regulator transcription factor [Pyrinomonadaceae bacterium]|nr:response regulator transcription factor [Pyrinomonadaceae bacterium]